MPSGRVLMALIPLFVLLAALDVYCLVDLVRAPAVRYLPKGVWALIILLVSAPLGALAYLVFGKDRGDHQTTDLAAAGGAAAGPAGRDGRTTAGR